MKVVLIPNWYYSTTITTIETNSGTYTCSITGTCGILTTEEIIVFIGDITPPTITCIENQTVTADDTETYTVVDDEFDPISTDDNCEIVSIINDINGTETLAGEELAQGKTHTITWTVTDIGGNETTCEFDVQVNAFVGIEDLSEIGISIYPNPTTGIVNINFAKVSNFGKVEITITDITGKVIYSKDVACNVSTTIDLSNNANGVYFIKFQNSKTVKTLKIIKQ